MSFIIFQVEMSNICCFSWSFMRVNKKFQLSVGQKNQSEDVAFRAGKIVMSIYHNFLTSCRLNNLSINCENEPWHAATPQQDVLALSSKHRCALVRPVLPDLSRLLSNGVF